MISAGSLGELLTHPEVAKFVDHAVLIGVSGRTQVDIAIGYVETALAHLTKTGRGDEWLQKCYLLDLN